MLSLSYSLYITIHIIVSVFANRPEDLGSIPGRVIPKTQKLHLMPPSLTFNIMRYDSGKGVTPSLIPLCSSYLKRSRRVILDNGRQLYFLFT